MSTLIQTVLELTLELLTTNARVAHGPNPEYIK